MAFNLRVLNNHELALEHAEKAVKIVNNSFTEDARFENSKWISPFYADVGRYKTAVKFLKKDVLLRKDTLSILRLNNDIGFYYYKDNQLDSAILYFEKTISNNLKDEKYKALVGLATGNLGAVYLAKEEYSKALDYLKIDAEINKNRFTSSYYNAMNAIAECYFKMGNYKEAIKTLDTLEHIKEEDFKKIDPASILKTYQLYMDSYSEINNSRKSLIYMRKYQRLQDSIAQKHLPYDKLYEQIEKFKLIALTKDIEISNTKNALLESEQQKMVVTFSLVISLIIFVFILIIAIILRYKRTKRIQKLNSELLVLELYNKKKDLNSVASNLSYNREFINETLERIKHIQKQPVEKIKSEIVTLSQAIKRFKNSDNSLAVLQTDMETINYDFYTKLKNLFPELTQNERELCGMILLNLSSKDIASNKNITPNAVKKARQRLRKKLPISQGESLYNFLEKI